MFLWYPSAFAKNIVIMLSKNMFLCQEMCQKECVFVVGDCCDFENGAVWLCFCGGVRRLCLPEDMSSERVPKELCLCGCGLWDQSVGNGCRKILWLCFVKTKNLFLWWCQFRKGISQLCVLLLCFLGLCCGISPRRLWTASKKWFLAQQQEWCHLTYIFAPQSKTLLCFCGGVVVFRKFVVVWLCFCSLCTLWWPNSGNTCGFCTQLLVWFIKNLSREFCCYLSQLCLLWLCFCGGAKVDTMFFAQTKKHCLFTWWRGCVFVVVVVCCVSTCGCVFVVVGLCFDCLCGCKENAQIVVVVWYQQCSTPCAGFAGMLKQSVLRCDVWWCGECFGGIWCL